MVLQWRDASKRQAEELENSKQLQQCADTFTVFAWIMIAALISKPVTEVRMGIRLHPDPIRCRMKTICRPLFELTFGNVLHQPFFALSIGSAETKVFLSLAIKGFGQGAVASRTRGEKAFQEGSSDYDLRDNFLFQIYQ